MRLRNDNWANSQDIQRLLGAGADINEADNAGLLPLHIAAGECAADAVRHALSLLNYHGRAYAQKNLRCPPHAGQIPLRE